MTEYRDRLYEAYATTHSGFSDGVTSEPAFKRDIAPHLPVDQNARIVDLGCGQGQLVRQLHSHGYADSYGIDVSPEQVSLAHQAGISEIELGDFHVVFSPDSLDSVIATDFFEHLSKQEVVEAADRVHESLRSGGTLIMRVPNSGSPFVGNIQHGDMTHETCFTARSVRQLAATTGFGRVEIYPCNPPAHGMISFLRGIVWRFFSGMFKLGLAAETGKLRGNVVTQNLIAVLHKPRQPTPASSE